MNKIAIAGVFVVVAVGGGVVGSLLPRGGAAPAAPEAKAVARKPVSITSAAALKTELADVVEVTGSVRPKFDAAVTTRVMGRVTAVLVREGDRVRKGQLLATMDARDLDAGVSVADANLKAATVGYRNSISIADMEERASAARISQAQAGVDQAEAGLRAAKSRLDLVRSGPRKQERTQAALSVVQAKAALDMATSNHRRFKELLQVGAVSQQQYEATETQLNVAKASFDLAEQSQSMADEGSRQEDIRGAEEGVRAAEGALGLSRATLAGARAGADEVEVRRRAVKAAAAQVGQMQAGVRAAKVSRDYAAVVAPFDGVVSHRSVDPGAMAGPGVPLLQVQGGPMRLEAVVPESLLSSARVGALLPIELDALPGRRVNGTVAEVEPQGDAASHTFVVRVELPAGAGVQSGMFGRVRLAAGQASAVLVPAAAVVDRDGLMYVYVTDGQVARMRLITTGRKQGAQLVVLSGVAAGDRVVTSGLGALEDGAPVEDGITAGRL